MMIDNNDEELGHSHLESSNITNNSSSNWKSLGSKTKIRFASQRSDVNNDELRGIVATPLDVDVAKPMAPRARLFKNIQTEVEDVAGGLPGAAQQLFKRSSTLQHHQEEGNGSGSVGVDTNGGDIDSSAGDSFAHDNPNQMYRLEATRGGRDASCFRRTLRFFNACINCGAISESATEQHLYLGFANPNRWLIDLFFWMFRKGWLNVIILSVIWYYALVLLFGLFIVWAAKSDHDCVRVGGIRSGDLDRSLFMDAFSLSWNTFSTVGYGSSYPALSSESDGEGDARCVFIHFLTSFEAFVGVLYAGFTGAIFFAKFRRITQQASIRFSDPLTVRFGSGVDVDVVDDDEDKPDERRRNQYDKKPLDKLRSVARKVGKQSPFPVITFRIANEMHNVMGGEIINAQINAVVLIESDKYEDEVSEDLTKQINIDRTRRASIRDTPGTKLRKATSQSKLFAVDSSERTERTTVLTERSNEGQLSLEVETVSSEDSKRSADSAMTYLQGLNALVKAQSPTSKKMKIDEEEGNSSSIVPRMVFTKVKLETSRHPLFKRIWRFKHIINAESPLLTPQAQRTIQNNRGKWPNLWNNHTSVRRALRFNQMVVSFTGISNISGASVYKQKVYDYVDIVVGYKFCNALYRGRNGTLKVDLELVNDVIEQNGGGGEPLKCY